MKIASLIIVGLFVSSAQAVPSKGSFILHECALTGRPSYQVKTEITAVNPAKQTVEMRISYSMPAALPQISTLSFDEFSAGEQAVKNLALDCGSDSLPGGQLVSVDTQAGVFQACKMSGTESGVVKSTYLADVPFQMLKLESDSFTCTAIKIQK